MKTEWLKEDIAGVKLYLNENLEIERPIGDVEERQKALEQAIALWIAAKHHADRQKFKYKKQWENVKDEALGVAISGGLSVATGNPLFVIGKLAQFSVNRISDKSDPHGQDKGIQALKTIVGAGIGGAMGGNVWDLGTALGVDLLDLSTEDPNKERSAIRGLGSAILKGTLTQDAKKFVTHFLCGAVAETARKLPKNDENTPLDVRIMRALLSNSDVHAYYVGKWLDQSFKNPPKPKTGGIPTPEEQEKYPKQQPTDLDLKIKKAHDELIQKEAGVENAFIYLDDKQFDYDRDKSYHQDKSRSKLKKGIKNYNSAVSERDAAFNKLAELSGDPQRINTPPVKIPKKAGNWEKTTRWIRKNVSGSGEVTVGSVPLYQTKTPQRSDPVLPSTVPENSIQHTSNIQPANNLGSWEAVEQQFTQQMFEMNMAYRPPVDTSFKGNLDYRGQRLNIASTASQRQMQMAGFAPLPMDVGTFETVRKVFINDFTKHAPETAFKVTATTLKLFTNLFLPDMSGTGAENPQDHINRIVTPEAVGNFVKSLPKGLAYTGKGVINLMLPDMSDVKGAEDPKAHFNQVFHSSMKKYDKIVQIQNPDGLASRSGMFVGEMLALGSVGKVMRAAEGITVFGMACEGGFMGAIMSEAHETNRVAGVAFGFIGGAGFGKLLLKGGGASAPLIDRALVRPEGFGRQLRNTEIQQVLRCGFVSDKTVMRLTEREIKAITPMKLPYLKKGADWDWFAKNSPRIDQLRNIARNNKEFHKFVVREFKPQNLKELQIRRTLNYARFNTYARPQGLPSNVVVEFSKKNGGMSYRCPGTTTDHNLVVRVCPGFAEESIVSSVHKGNHLNGKMPGTLRQQYPYVVQTKNNLTLTRNGEWIDLSLPCNKGKEALTHIPLETYQFKGWGQ